MSTWVVVAGASALVATLRVAFVVGNGRLPVPGWLDRAATLAAPAVTAALVAPRAFAAGGHIGVGPESVALVLALPVAVRTRSIGWTLAVGMPIVWVARAFG